MMVLAEDVETNLEGPLREPRLSSGTCRRAGLHVIDATRSGSIGSSTREQIKGERPCRSIVLTQR